MFIYAWNYYILLRYIRRQFLLKNYVCKLVAVDSCKRIKIYIYKRALPLTHSLTQHGPGDSVEHCITNFGVQIGFEALTPTKTGFCEIPPPSPRGGADVKNTFPHFHWEGSAEKPSRRIGRAESAVPKGRRRIVPFRQSKKKKRLWNFTLLH